jgi:hypothetical protein
VKEASRVYVFALKREKRDIAPRDWQERVLELSGTPEICAGSPLRLELEVGDGKLAKIQAELGEFIHIEPLLLRSPGSEEA